MVEAGKLERMARGLYRLTDMPLPRWPALIVVAKLVPDAVICLISALDFHDLTTQIPHQVYVAISRKSRYPTFDRPPARFFRYQDELLEAGAETHVIEGNRVRVFSPERTIADCLKYRNKIGPDVALEALRLYWQRRRPDIQKLMEYARLCRVNRVIRPYLEILV